MEVNKSKIKENFLHEMQFGANHIKYEYKGEHLGDIEAAVDEICDLSVEIISNLTEQETIVLRKRLGVYNNGEKQTLTTVAKELDKSIERIRKIESQAYIHMIGSIGRGSYIPVDDRTKMSSLTKQEEYANFHISKLGIDKKHMRILCIRASTSLYDLLTYSYADFKKMGIGDAYYKQLGDRIHSLGLKFIEELTDDEKRMIVSAASNDMIDNSSIAWISNLSKTTLLMLSKKRIKTIGMLRKYIEEDGYVNEDAIAYASSIGINIGKKSKLSINNMEISIEELLDTSIKNVEMSIYLFNKLNRCGFKTIRDVVLHTTRDFDILFNDGIKTKDELFTLIHNFGLFFANEAPTMKLYSEEISSQLDSTSDGMKAKEELLLERYKKLTSEKEQLEARTQELDSELSVVMEQLNAMGKEVLNGQPKK